MARGPVDRNHIFKADSCEALLKKGAALLARRSYSRGELRAKLLKTAGKSRVKSALDRLEQLNLLNDAEYAYNFALYRLGQENWGSAKVFDALRRRLVDPETIKLALERVRSELGDETVSVLCMQKCCGEHWPPTDPKQIRRLIMRLHRRGFSDDTIFRALKAILPDQVFQRLEGE